MPFACSISPVVETGLPAAVNIWNEGTGFCVSLTRITMLVVAFSPVDDHTVRVRLYSQPLKGMVVPLMTVLER